VRLTRGTASFDFSTPFTYFEGDFPAEIEIQDIGEGWCTLVCPSAVKREAGEPSDGEPWFCPNSSLIRGGHDFNGDGMSDLLFAYWQTSPDVLEFIIPGTIFILPGSRDLPRELRTDAIENRAAIITSEVPFDFSGWRSRQTAILAGDMTGDGRSELAISAATSAAVYLIFGHEISPGPTTVQELLKDGKGCRIEGLPKMLDKFYHSHLESYIALVEAGDLNGDGLQDLGIVNDGVQIEIAGETVTTGCLSLVLGRRQFPPVLNFVDLPKVYGKLPLNEWATSKIGENTKGVGDVDGDGLDDIAMDCYSAGDEEEGSVGAFHAWFILFGRRSWQASTILDDELDTGGACVLVQMYWGSWTSRSPTAWVSGIGDEDRDGKDDLGIMVQIPGPSPSGMPSHSLFLLHGRSKDELSAPRDPNKPEDFDAVFPARRDSHAPLIMDGGRDFNGDGFPEILIHDRQSSQPPPARAIVLFGGNLEDRAGPLDDVAGKLEILNRGTCPEDQGACTYPNGFYFGGDVNGDRREDLVIGCGRRIWIYFNPLGAIDQSRPFRRGDSNSDGAFDLSDAVGTLGFLFLGGEEPPCMAATDVNDDGKVDITDPISFLSWLFLGSEPPAPPRECGTDPDGTPFDCRESACP